MGMKQPTDPIQLVAPVPSILTSARTLPAGLNWRTGISWTPSLCLQSSVWPLCPAPGTNKNAQDLPGPVATEPFVVYTPVECEWVTTEAGGRFEQMVTDATEARTAAAVARALWLGTGITTDVHYGQPPTLRRAATDVSIGGFAGALDDVVSTLLFAYENATGGAGGATLHIPTVMIPSALGGGGGGARVCWPEGNIYRGPLGSVVSPGPGYPHDSSAQGANGYGPRVSAGPPEVYKGNAYNEVWIYVSGPVEYAVSPIVTFAEDDTSRRWIRQNRYEVMGERTCIVRIDPCGVFAAKAINDAGEVS